MAQVSVRPHRATDTRCLVLLLASFAMVPLVHASIDHSVVAFGLEDCEGDGLPMASVYEAAQLGMASYLKNETGCVNIGTIEILVVTGKRRERLNLRTFLDRTDEEELSAYQISLVPLLGWTAIVPPPPPPAAPGLVGGHKDTRFALSCMTSQQSASILDDRDVAKARIHFFDHSGPRGASVLAQTRRLRDLPLALRRRLPAVPFSRRMNSALRWTWPTYDATLEPAHM